MSALASVQSADGFISGQLLADTCGISRQAVWKAVNALRLRGARIEAVTNKGYRLLEGGGMLREATICALLDKNMHASLPKNATALVPDGMNVRVFVYDAIDSTNAEAKRRCAEALDVRTLDGTVIIASKQTAGRGRMGRSFFSPDGAGLYLTLIYAPSGGITSPALLTATAAVGVCRALFDVYGVDAQIKWVNDIFVRGKKVCGILTEGVTNFETGVIDCAIVGIGINILPVNLPPELVNVAGSVLEDRNADTQRNALAASVVTHVFSLYNASDCSSAMSEYRTRSFLIDKTITVHPTIGARDMSYEAIVRGITDDAKLVVEATDGTMKTLESGEVHIGSEHVSA